MHKNNFQIPLFKHLEKALQLTRNRHDQGIATGADVAQAETELETTRAEAIDVGVQRAQTEHAIGVLVGKVRRIFRLHRIDFKDCRRNPSGLPSKLWKDVGYSCIGT